MKEVSVQSNATPPKPPPSVGYGVMVTFFCLAYLLVLGWLDFEVITPLVLPTDPCYYHQHPIPFWVDWLYMNGTCNGHPEVSLTHLILLITLCVIAGIRTGKIVSRISAK